MVVAAAAVSIAVALIGTLSALRRAARSALAHSTADGAAEPAERVPLRSPIDGRALALRRECEGPVRLGEVLLVLGDPSRLEVDLPSADAVRVHPGTPVLFEQWGGEEPLEGVVRTVEPLGFTKVSALGGEGQRVLVIADFTSPPALWERLGDGYRVEVGLDHLLFVLFNLGVEIGQLAFVILVLLRLRAFRILEIHWPRAIQRLPGYLVGTLGTYWTFQRPAILLRGVL